MLVAGAGVLGADPDIEVFARGVLATAEDAPVDPSLLAAAIDVVADQGRAEDFDRFLARFKSATTRRRSCATSTRWPSSTRPSWSTAWWPCA